MNLPRPVRPPWAAAQPCAAGCSDYLRALGRHSQFTKCVGIKVKATQTPGFCQSGSKYAALLSGLQSLSGC